MLVKVPWQTDLFRKEEDVISSWGDDGCWWALCDGSVV